MTHPIRQKAMAYITRERGGHLELLVFDHVDFPAAGTQVPAGSVDPGETPEEGALREAWEEVGVRDLRVVRYLGMFTWYCQPRQELHHRHVFHMTAEAELPDQWDHVVSGGIEDKGMRFRCYWLDAARAVDALSGEQGLYLKSLL